MKRHTNTTLWKLARIREIELKTLKQIADQPRNSLSRRLARSTIAFTADLVKAMRAAL